MILPFVAFSCRFYSFNVFSGDNDLRGEDYDISTDELLDILGAGTLYVLGQTTVDNQPHFGFHKYTGEEMAARKAYVLLSAASARSLDGRRLGSKPTKKGLYICGGKKVSIK